MKSLRSDESEMHRRRIQVQKLLTETQNWKLKLRLKTPFRSLCWLISRRIIQPYSRGSHRMHKRTQAAGKRKATQVPATQWLQSNLSSKLHSHKGEKTAVALRPQVGGGGGGKCGVDCGKEAKRPLCLRGSQAKRGKSFFSWLPN